MANNPQDFSLRGVDKLIQYWALPGSVCYFCEGGKTPARCRSVELRGIERKSRVLKTGADLLERVEPPAAERRERTVCLEHMKTMTADALKHGILVQRIDGYTQPAPK